MRREFPKSVKVAAIKKATRNGVIYCDGCGLPCTKFQIDHVRPDSLLGEPTLDNAELICKDCYRIKNPADTRRAAKAKRQEAKHLGAREPSTMRSRGFTHKQKPQKLPMPPPRPLYE